MNKFGGFLGRISDETCLKMEYFGSKFFKIAQALEAPLPDLLLCPQTPVQVND